MPHIKVELDFIPVEERLPEYGPVYGMIERSRYFWLLFFRDGKWEKYRLDEQTSMAGITITHWAEIPEMSHAS